MVATVDSYLPFPARLTVVRLITRRLFPLLAAYLIMEYSLGHPFYLTDSHHILVSSSLAELDLNVLFYF